MREEGARQGGQEGTYNCMEKALEGPQDAKYPRRGREVRSGQRGEEKRDGGGQRVETGKT